MTSVLGKLIQRELGREKYVRYRNTLKEKRSTDVFCDIYLSLYEKDIDELSAMLGRLLETVHTSVAISKKFSFLLIAYVFLMGSLFFLLPINVIMISAMAVATVCLLYKVWEFITNRYCNRDVRMVLIYKSVLFHLIDNQKK